MLPGYGAPPLAFAGYVENTVANDDTVTLLVSYGVHFESFEDLGVQIWNMLSSFGYTSNVILMGYSMGGFIAQTIAKQQPVGVVGLVLVSTGTATKGSLPLTTKGRFLELVKGITSTFRKKKDSEETDIRSRIPVNLVGTTDEKIMLRNLHGRYSKANTINTNVQMKSILKYMRDSKNKDMAEQAKGITQQVLILHGSRDSVLDVSSAQQLHAALPKTSTLYVIQGAGHGMVFASAEQVSAMVNNWTRKFVNPAYVEIESRKHVYSFGYLA